MKVSGFVRKRVSSLLFVCAAILVASPYSLIPPSVEPVSAQAVTEPYGGSFGVNNINLTDSQVSFRTQTSGQNTIHNLDLRQQRIDKAKSIGVTWDRVNLAWNDIERYGPYLSTFTGSISNAYAGEPDANPDTVNTNNDLVVSNVSYPNVPANSLYYRKWEGDEGNWCTSNEANSTASQKAPGEITWTWGTNDNTFKEGLTDEQKDSTLITLQNNGGLRQYTDRIKLNYDNGIKNLVVLQTAPRCRSIPESTNVPSGLNEPAFLDANGNPTNTIPSGNISESNLNPKNPWAFYVFRAVDKYKEYVNDWQIWNEMNATHYWAIPNLNDSQRAQLYGRLVEISKAIIDKVDPTSNIIMGGIVHDSDSDNWFTGGCTPSSPNTGSCKSTVRTFLETLKNSYSVIYPGTTFNNLFDFYALNRYCSPWATINYLNWVQNELGYNNKNFWLTETGGKDIWCADNNYTSANEANYVAQHIAYLLAYKTEYKIENFFHFQFPELVNNDLSLEYEMFKGFKSAYKYLSRATYSSKQVTPDIKARSDFRVLSGGNFVQRADAYQKISFTHPDYEKVSVIWDLRQELNGSNISILRTGNGKKVDFLNYNDSPKQFIINTISNSVDYEINLSGRLTSREVDHPESVFMVEHKGCSGVTLAIGTLCAQYYKGKNLQGPVIWEEQVSVNNNSLSDTWANASGPIANVPSLNDDFSVRYSGNIDLSAGVYSVSAQASDGIRVTLAGTQVNFGEDTWTNHISGSFNSTLNISVNSPGSKSLVIDYFEDTGDSFFNVAWNFATAVCLPGQNPPGGNCPRNPVLDEFQVNYYNNVIDGNVDFATRVPTYTNFLTTNPSTFSKINYTWSSGVRPVPDVAQPNLINENNFAIKFWGKFAFATGGEYLFKATSDDGIRMNIKIDVGGGQIITVPLLDDWIHHASRTVSKVVSIPPGQHDISIEYYENEGSAIVQLGWELASNSICTAPTNGTFCAKYYNNTNMVGEPILNRFESLNRTTQPNIGLEYSWAAGSPHGTVSANNFSAVWEGYMNFATTDVYRFITNSDNGTRLYVDGQIVIDDWESHAARTKTAYKHLTAGQHLVKVEYFEGSGDATMQFYWDNMTYLEAQNYDCSVSVASAFCAKFYNTKKYDENPRLAANYAAVLQPSTFSQPGRTGSLNSWGTGSPHSRVITDGFTGVFEGRFTFTDTGRYEFTSQSDDGMIIMVDGVVVVDNWGNHPLVTVTKSVYLTAGQHAILVKYYDNTSGATANFWWEKVSTTPVSATYPYGIVRADTDPFVMQSNSQYTAIKDIAALFDGVYTWPNNAVVHYVAQTPISVIIEFKSPVSISGFKLSSASEKWDVYKADSWSNMQAGNYTVVGTNYTAPVVNGYANVNFGSSQTAKVFKIKFTRITGDGIVHIADIVPTFATTGGGTGPSLAPIPNQTIKATTRWIYRPQVSDPNDNWYSLNFSLGSNPQGITYAINPTSTGYGYLDWTPWFNHIGTHNITVEVRDSSGNLATRTFTLTVIP